MLGLDPFVLYVRFFLLKCPLNYFARLIQQNAYSIWKLSNARRKDHGLICGVSHCSHMHSVCTDLNIYALCFFYLQSSDCTNGVISHCAVDGIWAELSPRFLCRPTALYMFARAVGRQRAIHTENSRFSSPSLGQHISTFRVYRILFSIRNPYINRFTNHFSIHS